MPSGVYSVREGRLSARTLFESPILIGPAFVQFVSGCAIKLLNDDFLRINQCENCGKEGNVYIYSTAEIVISLQILQGFGGKIKRSRKVGDNVKYGINPLI